MQETKRVLFIFLGIICLILAALGGMLPIMPGFAFLALAGICFAKGSKKFNKWLINRKFYKKYLRKHMGKYIEKDLKDELKYNIKESKKVKTIKNKSNNMVFRN